MNLGDATLVAGYVLTVTSALLNVLLHDGRDVRAVGRVVLAVAGAVTRPLVRRLRESPVERCARLDHDRRWDNYFESCARCGASSRPEVHLPSPRVGPTTPSGVSPPRADPTRWPDPALLLEDPLRSRVRADLERDVARLVRDRERAWGAETGDGRSILGRRHR